MKRVRLLEAVAAASCAAVLAEGCRRETRGLNEPPPGAVMPATVSDLQPGPIMVVDTTQGPFDGNAYRTAEGQTLFSTMNCVGCHSHGGGGMGPALTDDEWTYGSRPDQIYATIAEGRPNGMPAWKYRLTATQIWELVAYVRSLSGLTPKGARPGRVDEMMTSPAPNQTPNATPKNSGPPH